MNPELESKNVWVEISRHIQKKLNKQIFDSWFKPIKFQDIDLNSGVMRLRAKEVTSSWVKLYYSELLSEALVEVGIPGFRIDWIADADVISSQGSSQASFTQGVLFQEDQKQLGRVENISLVKQSFNGTKVIGEKFGDLSTSLNPRYKFEGFVEGTSNQFALAAAKAVVDSPGNTYNPLFIYSGVGLGKTHLLHSIGNELKKRDFSKKVAYVTSERFMNDLISAIRFDKTQEFREKYRSVDVLLMDDVQFMSGKERTQEEFFHTFNALHNEQKQIVVTSDRPPKEINSLEERLHSRFEWGLIADIEAPDIETKVAILMRKADMNGIDLSEEVAFFLAGKIKTNIRELEGILVRLIAISSLRGLTITKLLAQDAIKTLVDEKPAGITINKIQQLVAEDFGLTLEQIKSKNNSRNIAVPRQVAMYLCKKLLGNSYPEIGREFGNKHHTTVMHSVEKIDLLCKTDRDLHNRINGLIEAVEQ